MTIRRICSLTAILLLSCCCSFPLQGKEQHLRFDTETDVYELTFDDQVISYGSPPVKYVRELTCSGSLGYRR